jgi:transposase
MARQRVLEQQAQARLRAEGILEVQAGRLTATAAAKRLGVSRKTYYQWERRGLAGLVTALTDRPAGRPATPVDPEKNQLEQRVQELTTKVAVLSETAKLREQVRDLPVRDLPRAPRRGRTKKKSRAMRPGG